MDEAGCRRWGVCLPFGHRGTGCNIRMPSIRGAGQLAPPLLPAWCRVRCRRARVTFPGMDPALPRPRFGLTPFCVRCGASLYYVRQDQARGVLEHRYRATGAASSTRPGPSGTRPGRAHPRAEQVSRLTALAHAPGRPGRPVDGAHQPAHAQRSSRENGAAPGEESELRSPRSAAGHVGGQAPSARELHAPVRPLPGPPVLPAPVGRLRKP